MFCVSIFSSRLTRRTRQLSSWIHASDLNVSDLVMGTWQSGVSLPLSFQLARTNTQTRGRSHLIRSPRSLITAMTSIFNSGYHRESFSFLSSTCYSNISKNVIDALLLMKCKPTKKVWLLRKTNEIWLLANPLRCESG